MSEEAHRWAQRRAGESFEPVDRARAPAPNEVLVEIDACSLWRRVGFAFGAGHAGADGGALRQRIDGHVVEAGEEAMYLVDRPVSLSGAVPCGQHEACWTGAVADCPHKAATPGSGEANCVIASASDVELAEKRPPRAPGLGLDPFKDER